jgi:thymidine phosphorylase
VEVTLALAIEAAALVGVDLAAEALRQTLASGRAMDRLRRWAVEQGASAAWFERPDLALAPLERVIPARRSGVLARVATRRLGLLLGEAGGARRVAGEELDRGIALRCRARLGDTVGAGQELARVYLRRDDPGLVERFTACFEVADAGCAPPLIASRVPA